MAWTYTSLKDAILNYLAEEQAEVILVENLPVIIQQAEDRILTTAQLPDFRKNCTGSLTGNDQYLGIPPDFLSPYSLAVEGTSGQDYLLFKDVSFIRQAYPVTLFKAQPKYYSLFNDEFFLVGPTPDQNYAVELHYFHRPASIVDAGTSWLGTHAISCLFSGCMLEAYIFQKGDADMIAKWETRYADALEKLLLLSDGRNKVDTYRHG